MGRTIKEIVKNPQFLFMTLGHYGLMNWMSDKTYLKTVYRIRMGRRLNLDEPRLFSEKLQWLKLYDHNPEYTTMVDKYAAKQYVGGIIGEEYIVPTLGVWDRFDDIDFSRLPDRFVLKCTHDSGGLVVCKDKSELDIGKARRKIGRCLRSNYYWGSREWPYKDVPRRIIAEAYLDYESYTDDLLDYKFFCFGGEPKYCQVIGGRGKTMCIDFFDREWRHQPFHEPRNYPFAPQEPSRPDNLDEMWGLAAKLAKDKPFSRIDFYNFGGKVYFGEITFFPTSGTGGFDPEEYDERFGRLISLPGRGGQ